MYCTPMFILRCVCNVIQSCHTPMFISGSFYNINKSCQVIVVNPPIVQGLSPCSFGALGLLDSPSEVGPSESLSSQELVIRGNFNSK